MLQLPSKIAIALVVAASFPIAASAQAHGGTVLLNETLGISVTRPAGWHTLTAAANAENLERMELPSDFKSALVRYARVPLFAFSKYPEPHDDLNPSFRITVREAGMDQNRSSREILDAVLPPIAASLNGAVKKVQDVQVDGLPSAYARLKYVLKSGGNEYPTVSEFWIVPRGSYFFIFGAGTRQDEGNGTRAEIASIVESVKFSR